MKDGAGGRAPTHSQTSQQTLAGPRCLPHCRGRRRPPQGHQGRSQHADRHRRAGRQGKARPQPRAEAVSGQQPARWPRPAGEWRGASRQRYHSSAGTGLAGAAGTAARLPRPPALRARCRGDEGPEPSPSNTASTWNRPPAGRAGHPSSGRGARDSRRRGPAGWPRARTGGHRDRAGPRRAGHEKPGGRSRTGRPAQTGEECAAILRASPRL